MTKISPIINAEMLVGSLNLEKAFQCRGAEKNENTEAWRKFLDHPLGDLVFLCVPLLAPRLGVEKGLATAVFRLKTTSRYLALFGCPTAWPAMPAAHIKP